MADEATFRQRVQRFAKIARGELADMDLVLSKLLLWMVRVSVLVLLFGLVVVALTGFTFPHRTVRFDRLITEVTELRPAAILDLGILILISVPLTRVGLSLFLFLRKRDRTYTLMTSRVLVILLGSLALGVAL